MQSLRPTNRTSVTQPGPWTLTLTYSRQVYCPACGIRMPKAVAVLADDVLVCGMCVRESPRAVTQAIAVHRSNTVAHLWGHSHGIHAYFSRSGLERTAVQWAVELDCWSDTDQPCDYPEYIPISDPPTRPV